MSTSAPTFTRVSTGAPWEERYGYCRALRAGDHVHVTGTAPVEPDGRTHAPGDAAAQARRCFQIIDRALRQLGARREHIVRTRMFVTDIALADDIGRAHAAYMGAHRPCTTLVEVQALIDPEMLVEIEVDAYAPVPPPHLAGDPRFHLTMAQLEAGHAALPAPPRDRGRLVHLVRRHRDHDRELPHSARLTVEDGLVGDLWSTGRRNPDAQLATMRADVGALIANGQSPGLFGDQLHLDLDLSHDNLPAGSRLRIGQQVVVEVTPKPHNGCDLYQRRFGSDALRFISARVRRHLRLRGIYLKVVEPGRVVVDDAIVVLHRGPA